MSYRIESECGSGGGATVRYGCAVCLGLGVTKSYSHLQGLHAHRLKSHPDMIKLIAKNLSSDPERRKFNISSSGPSTDHENSDQLFEMFRAGCRLLVKPMVIKCWADVGLTSAGYITETVVTEVDDLRTDALHRYQGENLRGADGLQSLSVKTSAPNVDSIWMTLGNTIAFKLPQMESSTWQLKFCPILFFWSMFHEIRLEAHDQDDNLVRCPGELSIDYVKIIDADVRCHCARMERAALLDWQDVDKKIGCKYGLICTLAPHEAPYSGLNTDVTENVAVNYEENPNLLEVTLQGPSVNEAAEMMVSKFGASWNGVSYQVYPPIVHVILRKTYFDEVKSLLASDPQFADVDLRSFQTARFPLPTTSDDIDCAARKTLKKYRELVSEHGIDAIIVTEPEDRGPSEPMGRAIPC